MAGDTESLGRVLERYRVRLGAVVIATGVYHNVEDVVQEALLKIVQAVRTGRVQLRSLEQFRGWAHAVARNCALDTLRARRREPRRFSSIFGGAGDSTADAAGRIAGDGVTPSVHARSREELQALRHAFAERCERIAGLRRPDQILVWMRERDGLTFQQIAGEFAARHGVEVSEDAMRVRYGRLCKDRIGPFQPEPPPPDAEVIPD
ncbi:MAG: sigma factor [Planctomycetota bacterium]